MRKQYAILFGAMLLSLAIHSCQVPTAVKIKTDKLNLEPPVKTGSSNIGGILSKALKDAFPEGFQMYDMVNYTDAEGKPVQAFLVNYEMDIMDSFNPGEYLGDIDGQISDINDMDTGNGNVIDTTISVPSMTPDGQKELCWFDMGVFYNEVETELNNTSMPPTSSQFPVQKPGGTPIDPSFIAGINANMPELMVIPDSNHPSAFTFNFDEVILDGGAIKLRFSLDDGAGAAPANGIGTAPADTDIAIQIGVSLTGLKDSATGNAITTTETAYLDSTNYIVINGANRTFADEISISLQNTKIDRDNPLKFQITSITNNSTQSGFIPVVSTRLTIQPQLEGIKMRGATGLRIGRMEQPLPADMADSINLGGSMPPELINAQIGEGTLIIKATLPPRGGPVGNPYDPNLTTYSTGLTIGYEIPIKQVPHRYENKTFPGLAGSDPALVVTDEHTNLAGKSINGETLEIDLANAKIIITSDPLVGADFELFNNDIYHYESIVLNDEKQALDDKVLPIYVEIGMEIKKLDVVRWKFDASIIPQPDNIEIDFGNITNETNPANAKDISKFIKNITFSELDIGIDFTADGSPAGSGGGMPVALKNRLGLVFSCPAFGLNQKRALDDGITSFGFTENDPEKTIDLRDANDQPVKLEIDVDICPVIGYDPANPPADPDSLVDPSATYLELGPLDLNDDPNVNGGNTDLALHGTINTSVNWSKAQVDLKEAMNNSSDPNHQDRLDMLKGTFPDTSKGEEPIDLSQMSKFLKGGFAFNGIQAKMFLTGPHKLIDKLAPSMIFDAQWKQLDAQGNQVIDGNGDPVFDQVNLINNEKLVITDALVKLPPANASGAYVYDGKYAYAGVNVSYTDAADKYTEDGKSLPALDGLDISSSGFTEILSAGPAGLGFTYEMVMECVEVTPDMFGSSEFDESGAIKAQMLLLMPLDLHMNAGSAIELSDMLNNDGKEEDLFGREAASPGSLKPKDDPFEGIEVNSIGIAIVFSDELFNGGKFYIDKNDKLFPNGIDLKGKSLGINIHGGDMDIVRQNIIIPGFKIGFPSGADLAIPREFMPVKMQINMSGSFTYQF